MLSAADAQSRLLPTSSHVDPRNKWRKNALRAALVGAAACTAVAAKCKLDALVAFIGGACSLPLALVFPPLCHDRLVGGAPWRDRTLAALGVSLAVFATAESIRRRPMPCQVHQKSPLPNR